LWVDHYGNCQLNVGPAELEALTDDEVVAVEVGDERRAARVVHTFAELGAGSLGLVLDSHGMYALVLDQRSAAAELAIAQGDAVCIVTVDGAAAAPGAEVGVAAPTTRRPGPGTTDHG
jgi:S-adenosylmethionine hydrolase